MGTVGVGAVGAASLNWRCNSRYPEYCSNSSAESPMSDPRRSLSFVPRPAAGQHHPSQIVGRQTDAVGFHGRRGALPSRSVPRVRSHVVGSQDHKASHTQTGTPHAARRKAAGGPVVCQQREAHRQRSSSGDGENHSSATESQGPAPHGQKLVVDWWSTDDGSIAHGGRCGILMGWVQGVHPSWSRFGARLSGAILVSDGLWLEESWLAPTKRSWSRGALVRGASFFSSSYPTCLLLRRSRDLGTSLWSALGCRVTVPLTIPDCLGSRLTVFASIRITSRVVDRGESIFSPKVT